jgi:hypothetical protein
MGYRNYFDIRVMALEVLIVTGFLVILPLAVRGRGRLPKTVRLVSVASGATSGFVIFVHSVDAGWIVWLPVAVVAGALGAVGARLVRGSALRPGLGIAMVKGVLLVFGAFVLYTILLAGLSVITYLI